MAKYSYEFKKQVIEAYLSGEGGYKYLAKRMESLLKAILSNGFTIIKLWEMKVYCVLEKMIYILSKKSFLL